VQGARFFVIWTGKRRAAGLAAALAVSFLFGAAAEAAAAPKSGAGPVNFNRDIRPILSDNCFACHGPDEGARQSPLRLDTKQGAFADLGGRFAIVPGSPEKSELVRRISSDNEAIRMPPAYAGHDKLKPEQIELIRRWIAAGAEWEEHWAFIPPRRPALPEVSDPEWPRNAIDYFVLAKLDEEGLKPSPEADRAKLIRRVSLDLTGLPPTPEQVDAFLSGPSPNAYEKAVDRLLDSPAYGERMAQEWLDAARYADTNGYQTDAERYMWRWRDWVIEAFNENMPFDQFTIEQIAGDLLPDPSLDQMIATGFNRNHRGNGEGGIIPEEYLVEYVVDRVETTSTVWLGLTVGCARCHDHKYDPISQQEFYEFFAYFHNVPERGNAFKYGNSPPLIKAPTRGQQQELARLEEKIRAAEERFTELEQKHREAQAEWEKTLLWRLPADWTVTGGLVARYPFDSGLRGDAAQHKWNESPSPPSREGEVKFTSGPVGGALTLDGGGHVEAEGVGGIGFYDKFTMAAWVRPEAPDGTIFSRSKVDVEEKGYWLSLKDGKLQLNLITRRLDDALRVETAEPLPMNEWRHVLVTYDASRLAKGVRIYINGKRARVNVVLDELNQPFGAGAPFRIGSAATPESRFRGRIDDVRLYGRVLSPEEAAIVATAETLDEIGRVPRENRSKGQALKLEWAFLDYYAPEPVRSAWNRLRKLRREKELLVETFPTVMVMKEMEEPRETFVLERGAYDRPGKKVGPDVPRVLPPLPEGAPNNRLGLARWLVDPRNPLPARVTVNRFWQMYFGTGLVKTVEDFGSQGERPVHQDLLDWLAVEFIESGWDVKALQRKIVTSATYRQASKAPPELVERDPENRLLARGPRFRLSAEMLRDQALAVSGLLVRKAGGPSVKPYQPAGLWTELAGGQDYERDHGAKLYRRSLYTFWKRTIAPPSMMNFDASARETCRVRLTRTNTPLQALNLMNDVTYVEAARVMAERMMTEGGGTPAERLAYGFRLATARWPKPKEAKVLEDSFRYHLENFRNRPGAAEKLLSAGEHPRNKRLDENELAAYATLASMILNLDEVVTKE